MLALGMIGMPELVLIGFIALLVYGKKLPEMARSLGKSVQEFKSGMQEGIPTKLEKGTNEAGGMEGSILGQNMKEIKKTNCDRLDNIDR